MFVECGDTSSMWMKHHSDQGDSTNTCNWFLFKKERKNKISIIMLHVNKLKKKQQLNMEIHKKSQWSA